MLEAAAIIESVILYLCHCQRDSHLRQRRSAVERAEAYRLNAGGYRYAVEVCAAGEGVVADTVKDEISLSPEQSVENIMLKEQIDILLQDLKERERQVIILRFGLEDGRPRTLEEVGQVFNVTRERIRQIEAKALKKLKNPVRGRMIQDYLKS